MTMLSLFQSSQEDDVSPPRSSPHKTATNTTTAAAAAAVTPESVTENHYDQYHSTTNNNYTIMTPRKLSGLGTMESPIVLEEKKSQDHEEGDHSKEVYNNIMTSIHANDTDDAPQNDDLVVDNNDDDDLYDNSGDDEEHQEDSLLDWLDDALADDPLPPSSPPAETTKPLSMTHKNSSFLSPLQAEETVSTAPITPESMPETHEPEKENDAVCEPSSTVLQDDDSVSVLSDDSPVERMEKLEKELELQQLQQQLQAPSTPKIVQKPSPALAESKIPTLSSKSRLLQPTASQLGTATSPVRNRTPKPAQARHLAEQRVRRRKLQEQKEREEAQRKELENREACRMTPQEGQVRAAARVYIRQQHAQALHQQKEHHTRNHHNAVSSPKIHPAKPKSNKPPTKAQGPSLSTSRRALYREEQKANANKPTPKPPATGMGTRSWQPTVPKAPSFSTDRRLGARPTTPGRTTSTRSTSTPGRNNNSTTPATSRRSGTPGRSVGNSSWKPTKPKEFSFATDRRLGEKPAVSKSSSTNRTAESSWSSASRTSTGRSSPRMRAPSPRFSTASKGTTNGNGNGVTRTVTPKRNASWRPTQPKEFSFATDRRIGRR